VQLLRLRQSTPSQEPRRTPKAHWLESIVIASGRRASLMGTAR
jgi:hypothetical protein